MSDKGKEFRDSLKLESSPFLADELLLKAEFEKLDGKKIYEEEDSIKNIEIELGD